MFTRGLKRKSPEQDGDAEGVLDGAPATAYSLQRQSLLDMSLVKLQLCHMLAEPNLCRSVLIANTVRQIQEEMAQDGTWCLAVTPTADAAPLQRLVSTDILCRPLREDSGQPGPGDIAQDLPPQVPPQDPEDSLWGAGGPHDGRGSLPAALGQIFETLEGKRPGAMGDLCSGVGSAYYDLDAMLTGMVGGMASPGDGLEDFAATATAPPSASCKLDVGEREHVVGVLVEA